MSIANTFFPSVVLVPDTEVSKLNERQKGIAQRLRQARELLGLTQEQVALQVGITRERLLIYEYGRAPLRFDLALRICRQLIISEEWLATGTFKAAFAVAQRLTPGATKEHLAALQRIFMRQSLDLASDPAYLEVPPSTDFAVAYDRYLEPVYRRLIEQFYHFPRVVFRHSDNSQLIVNYHTALLDRWLYLLDNESLRHGKDAGAVRASFLRALFEIGTIVFARFIGQATPAVQSSEAFEWLRIIAHDPETPIGPLFTQPPKSAEKSNRRKVLTR